MRLFDISTSPLAACHVATSSLRRVVLKASMMARNLCLVCRLYACYVMPICPPLPQPPQLQSIACEFWCALQEFAERLFSRLQKGNERLETRLCMMSVISRAVGVHQLLLLNFYPFLQKYIQPHQRDVTQILAVLVQVTSIKCLPLPLPCIINKRLHKIVLLLLNSVLLLQSSRSGQTVGTLPSPAARDQSSRAG